MTTTFQKIDPPLAWDGNADAQQQGERQAGQTSLTLVPSRCFICGDDDAEPVAVGEDFSRKTSPESFLAVCCRGCGLVYLNPWPSRAERERSYGSPELTAQTTPRSTSWESGRAWSREIARFCRLLPKQGRLLDLSCGEGQRLKSFREQLGVDWQLEGAATDSSFLRPGDETATLMRHGRVEELELPEGAYDAVVAIDVLEQEDNPLIILQTIKRVLRIGGKVLIATPNTNSTACQVFRGRHWSGYDFPRRRNLFRAEVLARSARLVGLEVTSMRTIAAPTSWAESLRQLLADWGTPQWAQAGLNRAWRMALAASGVIEWTQQRRGKGGTLVATLQRPAA